MSYVRFQSPTTNRHCHHVGVFALANGLAIAGVLSRSEHRWWRASNDWFNEQLIDPVTVDASLFARHPGAVSWFERSSDAHVRRAAAYLPLLRSHGLHCIRVETDTLESIVYRDAHQALALPPDAPSAPIAPVSSQSPAMLDR